MYFDRFDICEAWFLFLSLHHEGQNSNKYCRLCKLLQSFNPRPSLRNKFDLSENGLEIYTNLCSKEWRNNWSKDYV